jgi:hypothetical protein
MKKMKEVAQKIISKTISNVKENPLVVKENGCAACHVLFNLSKEMGISEQDASDLLSEVLFANPDLDCSFIDMVENIHMKRRLMGTAFAIKTREAKDKYLYSNFKNTLAELHSDLVNYGPDITLRKLLLSMISLEIAKNIGIDYHASTEELYYFMRKNDEETHNNLLEFINQLYQRMVNKENRLYQKNISEFFNKPWYLKLYYNM